MLIKKSLYILGRFKYHLPLMLVLFLIVSMIDIMGIGLIGPFVALIGHQGNIIDEWPIFLTFFDDNIDNQIIIIFVGASLALTFCLKGVVAFFVQKRILSLGYEIRTYIVDKLVKSYQEESYEDIAIKDVSSMVVNANTHVGLFVDSVFVPALRMTIEFIVVMGIFFLMAYTSLFLVGIITILMSLVLFIYFKFIKVRLFFYGQIMSNKEVSIISEIKHIIGAFREIRLLGVEGFFRKEIRNDVIKFGEAGVITRSLPLISRYVIEASLVSFIVAIVIYMLFQSQPIEYIFSLLSIFAVGAIRLVPSFSAIGLGFANIRSATYALDSLHDELTTINNTQHKELDNSDSSINGFNLLELRNVSYAYKIKKKSIIIKNISLRIERGDFIAISGKSGSGKSTLMDIMTGMLIPIEGEFLVNNIIIDGTVARDMKCWQSKCAFIPQNVFLINNSIKRNIALGVEDDDIDNERLKIAITGANLEQVILQNNMNIDSNVGEGGVKLSGGQRQRVALARALYAGREVIFMDEATSALDKETEDEVMTHIESLRGKVTIILITHSQSALKNCNQVFNLINGSFA